MSTPIPASVSLPGHTAPTAGFEVPLEMLSACHHRIVTQCATLRKLVMHLAQQGADDDARTAATAVLRYFDTAAPDHHADEEADLFPALIESMAGSDPVCIREMIHALKSDHRAIEGLWRDLRPKILTIAAGESGELLADDVQPLILRYEAHIAREDGELLPMAARLLTDEALEAIGRAMRERRHIFSVE